MKERISFFLLAMLCPFYSTLYAQAFIELPLRQIDKFIVLEATIGHTHTGYLILDTGASATVLHAKYFRGDFSGRLSLTGLYGADDRIETGNLDVQIGGHTWKYTPVLIKDLSVVEDHISPVPFKILGILGINFFQDGTLTIDYLEGKLSFGQGRPPTASPALQIITLPFRQSQGLPIVEVHIDGRPYLFGIDSGCNLSLMDRSLEASLASYYQRIAMAKIKDMHGQKDRVQVVALSKVSLGGYPLAAMRVAFTDLRQIKRIISGQKLDGILGLLFLKQGRLTLDFPDQQMVFVTKPDERIYRQITPSPLRIDTAQHQPRDQNNE